MIDLDGSNRLILFMMIKHNVCLVAIALLVVSITDLRSEEKMLVGEVTSLQIKHDGKIGKQTDLRIRITTDGMILGLQEEMTKLTSFSDNLGTNLLEQGIDWRKQQKYKTTEVENGICCRNIIIHDKSINFPVNVTAVPAPGATTFTAKGQIALYFSPPEGTKMQRSEALPFQKCKGQEKFGDYTITLGLHGTEIRDGVIHQSLRIYSSVLVAKITFLDQAGKELINMTPEKHVLKLEKSVIDNVAKIQLDYLLPVVRIIPFEVTTGVRM